MKWRVFNLHPQGFTHREKFRDEMVEIPAGKYILMDYEDAVLFKGQYFPMRMTADGAQDPISFKVIKIEPDGDAKAQADVKKVYVCHMDGKEFASASELKAYELAKYGDLEKVEDAMLDAELEKQASSEAPKRGRGRPPKEKTL